MGNTNKITKLFIKRLYDTGCIEATFIKYREHYISTDADMLARRLLQHGWIKRVHK